MSKECNCGTSGIGQWAGSLAGSVGDGIDRFVSNRANAFSKRIKGFFGTGDYELVFNSLIPGQASLTPASITSTGRGLIVRHKEYLGDVYTDKTTVGGFQATKYVVNPGNVTTFPWLSPIANQYDQYRPLGVIFNFVSTAADYSSASSLGSVIMTTQYDVSDPDVVSKADMLNRAYSNEMKMSESGAHGLECNPAELFHNMLYCRTSSGATSDPRDYDMANFYIATQGGNLAVNTNVGSLYIMYEFEFFKAVPMGGIPQRTALWSSWTVSSSTPQAINWTNFPPALTEGRDMGISFDNLTVTFPKKWAGMRFLFNGVYFNGTTTAAAGSGGYTSTNVSSFASRVVGASNYWSNAGATANRNYWTLLVTLADTPTADPTITFSTTLGLFPATSVVGETHLYFDVIAVSRDYDRIIG